MTIHEILGPKGVLSEPADMAGYLDDLQAVKAGRPHAVLRPASATETCAALRYCAENGLAVIPQGGLTGLTGAAVPAGLDGAVILSTGRMNAIRSVDAEGGTMVAEAGAILADIRAAAEAENRYFPLHHGAVGSSQIGGNLSTNAGGNNALRYGTSRDQVLGLEVALPDGRLWDGLRALPKNTAGYDLRQLFIGAEGTLGIITAATLKLRPFPSNRVTAFAAVPTPSDALKLLRHLETQLGETISAFELLSDSALGFALQASGTTYPLEDRSPWAVLVEAETAAIGWDLGSALEAGLASAIETGLSTDAAIAQNGAQRQALWHLRESIATVMVEDKSSLKSDTAVPISAIPAFIEAAGRAVSAFMPGARLPSFGHLGDGNIHFNVVRPVEMEPGKFRARWDDLAHLIAKEALALGGTISAEHGIGRLKRDALAEFGDPVGLDLMRRLKNALDPDRRMNPGAIIDW